MKKVGNEKSNNELTEQVLSIPRTVRRFVY